MNQSSYVENMTAEDGMMMISAMIILLAMSA